MTGQLIYHKTIWFTQKNVTLFNGADSAVTTIAWRGNVVAWGDATQVRIMDLATQSAICFLNCPQGVSTYSPLPCCLFWESESDLYIGWADSIRHVELSIATGGPGESEVVTARSVVDWETDCIVCGLSSFDADHMIILGYAPPFESDLGKALDDDDDDDYEVYEDEKEDDEDEKSNLNNSDIMNNQDINKNKNENKNNECEDAAVVGLSQPEIQIILRSTGEVISSDLLVLKHETMGGPSSFRMLSTYDCFSRSQDGQKWRLNEVREKCPRGGLRGLAPSLFILSPQDFVVARVRDVNDYIKKALDDVDLKGAVELAQGDRLSLKTYRYADLLSLYLEDLLDRDRTFDFDNKSGNMIENETVNPITNINSNSNGGSSSSSSIGANAKLNYLAALTQTKKKPTDYVALAARECSRLIGNDAVLWERWVYAFAKRRHLHHISPFIPVKDPRLPNTVYEVHHICEQFIRFFCLFSFIFLYFLYIFLYAHTTYLRNLL